MNKIHAVITATEGANNLSPRMLDYTLKFNTNQLEEVTIITDFKSQEVVDIANKYNLKYIKTELFYKNNAVFDRGLVLSDFLMDKKGWILHLDCDILLPKSFKDIISKKTLDKNIIYGSRRIMFENLKDAEIWYESNQVNKNIFCPIGFCYGYFQMFNMESESLSSSSKNSIYPNSGHIGDHDVWFRNKWGILIDTNNDIKNFNVIGNIEELPFKVAHLGFSSVDNPLNSNFFIK